MKQNFLLYVANPWIFLYQQQKISEREWDEKWEREKDLFKD